MRTEVYRSVNPSMRIQIEYDLDAIYDLYINDGVVSIMTDDIADELVVSLDDTATVYELHPYIIENLADLFAALKKRDTIVLSEINAEGFIYDGELSNKRLDDSDWFDYCGQSYVLNELIFNGCICKQSKPKELTFKQIIKRYYDYS